MESGYVTLKDIATYFAVSEGTIRNMVRSGEIPDDAYIKLKGAYRFSLEKVELALLKDKAATKTKETTND